MAIDITDYENKVLVHAFLKIIQEKYKERDPILARQDDEGIKHQLSLPLTHAHTSMKRAILLLNSINKQNKNSGSIDIKNFYRIVNFDFKFEYVENDKRELILPEDFIYNEEKFKETLELISTFYKPDDSDCSDTPPEDSDSGKLPSYECPINDNQDKRHKIEIVSKTLPGEHFENTITLSNTQNTPFNRSLRSVKREFSFTNGSSLFKPLAEVTNNKYSEKPPVIKIENRKKHKIIIETINKNLESQDDDENKDSLHR